MIMMGFMLMLVDNSGDVGGGACSLRRCVALAGGCARLKSDSNVDRAGECVGVEEEWWPNHSLTLTHYWQHTVCGRHCLGLLARSREEWTAPSAVTASKMTSRQANFFLPAAT